MIEAGKGLQLCDSLSSRKGKMVVDAFSQKITGRLACIKCCGVITFVELKQVGVEFLTPILCPQ